jgi:hypothetical protein
LTGDSGGERKLDWLLPLLLQPPRPPWLLGALRAEGLVPPSDMRSKSASLSLLLAGSCLTDPGSSLA